MRLWRVKVKTVSQRTTSTRNVLSLKFLHRKHFPCFSSSCKHGEGRPSSHPATSAFSPHSARPSNTSTTGRSVLQCVVALVCVRPTSPSRRSLSKIEAHPQFVRRSAVALVHVGPASPHQQSLLKTGATPLSARRSAVALVHTEPTSPHRRSRPETEECPQFAKTTLFSRIDWKGPNHS